MTTFTPGGRRGKPMRLQVYWNPLHPAVGMKDAIRTLALYYILLTLTLAVVGVDVTSSRSRSRSVRVPLAWES